MFGGSCKASGGPSSSENRAHRPGGDGECCPGDVRSLLQGQGGASIFGEPGAPAWGGRGARPRGCSESPARPVGGHPLQRTGRTGLGGTGSPAQGVFGVSCKARGGPVSSEKRAHQPGKDGKSCPGGVRSLLPGQWGAIFFREPGAPAWGGRGVLPRGCSEPPARPVGGQYLRRTGRTGPGGTGSPAQGVFGVSCQANWGPSPSENRAHQPGGDGKSCPGGVRSLLPGPRGAIFFREPGAPALGGRGAQPRGCSESPARPMGGHLLQRTGRTGPGGTGTPAQGVFGASCQGQWGAIFFREPGALVRGGRGVLPRGCSESPARPVGGHLLQRTGRTGPGGTGSPAQGVFGVSCQANWGPSSSENRAHQPGGDGKSCPGGVRSLLPGPRGAIFFREPGAPAWGGRGVLPRGCSESPARPGGGQYLRRTRRTGLGGTGSPTEGVFGVSCKARGGPVSSENQAHRPGGDGKSCPGGVRSLLPGQWGAILFGEPGAPAWGGRGVLPRGCLEPPARPVGGQYLRRTGRTGLRGTGSPAQGVFGVSCKASGGPSSSENRAHRPGGDGESCPGGVRSLLPGPMGGHLLQRTGRTGPGGTGSPAQGVFGVSCKASGGPSSSENRAHRPGGDGESCPGGVRSLLPGQLGAIFFREPGAPARGGRGVLPRGCSESPARPVGGHLLQRTGRTGPGGAGSPAQGVFGVSCHANWGPSSSENRAHRPRGGRGVLPRGCSESPARPVGGHLLQRTGRTGPGGTGSPAQGVFGVSCQANWGPSSSENRAHRPGGDGESCPGGVRSLLPGLMGGHLLQRTGRTGLGGTGSPAQGVFGVSCKARGGPVSSENQAHRPGGDAEPDAGGVRSLLQGQWGTIFFREPGAPAWGGRGVLPRGCSESPARPVGGQYLRRTRRTSPGRTGSPVQGVFGVFCQANGGPSSSENRAHRPGGDGESCPGGVRSLLQGQWGASIFGEPGAPALGGRGAQPRGCSESPARPVGGHLLQRTGRTGPGGTGTPAQGVFGVSCKASGGPSSSENRAHRPGGDGESCPGGVRSLLSGQLGAIFFREPDAPARGGRGVLPRGCSESPARPVGGHLLQRTGRTGPGGTGVPAQGVFGASCQRQSGAIFFREPGVPAWGGLGVLPRGCSEAPARPVGGHLLQRTGRTSLGGTGSPAQGVFGVSCQANGGPSSSENRAHQPGGDGKSCPGGVRSLLPGQWGAIFFREPGAPAWGGRGVLPRGCSEPPARPVGGQYLRRTGRTGLGGTGSPAQGVFGASGRTRGYSPLPLSSSRQVSRQYRGS